MLRDIVGGKDRRWGWKREGGTGLVAVIDPAGKDGIGSSTNGRIFLIAGCYLTEAGLGNDKDFVRELEFGKIVDDREPDCRSGDI